MGKRVLVIDDDEDILEILNVIFQETGYDIVMSNTGEAAEHLQLIQPDLVLLDVRIVGSAKDGPGICREIKAQFETRHLPVMAGFSRIRSEYYCTGMRCRFLSGQTL